MRVLLVEDEPAAAQVLAKGLREHAYAGMESLIRTRRGEGYQLANEGA